MSEYLRRQLENRQRKGLTVDEFDEPEKLAFLAGDRLAGKNVLIVGGTNGIGQATAIVCALQGANVVVNHHSNESRVKYMTTLLERAGADLSRVAFIQADITKQEQIYRLYDETIRTFEDGIDAVCLFAAGGAGQDESVSRTINYIAPLNLAEITCEQRVFSDQGGTLLWVTSNYALNYTGVVDSPDPALTDYLNGYHPVAIWKCKTSIELHRKLDQFARNNIRLLTLSGPVIPHTSAIDVLQMRNPDLYPILTKYYSEASRLDMAAGTLDLLTNADYSSRHVLSVTKNYSHRLFPR